MKPPRMRRACSRCHEAKIRCSGERSGCARCQSLGLYCEYGVSMVGRFSAQTRKARLEAERKGINQVSDAAARPPVRGTTSISAPSVLDPDQSSYPERREPASNRDPVVSHDTTALLGVKNATPDRYNAGGSTSSAGLLYHDLNFRLDEDRVPSHLARNANPQASTETALSDVISGGDLSFTGFPFDGFNLHHNSNQPFVLKPNFSMPSSSLVFPRSTSDPGSKQTDPPTRESVDADIVVHLAHTISCLEIQLKQFSTQERPSIDKVLQYNKLCIAKITGPIESGENLRYLAFRALTAKTIDLVVSLYEMCRPQNDIADSVPLRFGIFEINADDQVAFRREIFGKEVYRCIRLIQRLREQSSWLVLERGLDCGCVQHYARLEQRASMLISSLKG